MGTLGEAGSISADVPADYIAGLDVADRNRPPVVRELSPSELSMLGPSLNGGWGDGAPVGIKSGDDDSSQPGGNNTIFLPLLQNNAPLRSSNDKARMKMVEPVKRLNTDILDILGVEDEDGNTNSLSPSPGDEDLASRHCHFMWSTNVGGFIPVEQVDFKPFPADHIGFDVVNPGRRDEHSTMFADTRGTGRVGVVHDVGYQGQLHMFRLSPTCRLSVYVDGLPPAILGNPTILHEENKMVFHVQDKPLQGGGVFHLGISELIVVYRGGSYSHDRLTTPASIVDVTIKNLSQAVEIVIVDRGGNAAVIDPCTLWNCEANPADSSP
jgi:hypothetical protein